MKYEIEEIESIECIGEFSDEYVYDIEVDDDTHTFIGNDILVHNSCYVQFAEMYESIEWLGEKQTIDKFIMSLYNFRLKEYISVSMAKYARKTNTDNFLFLELETIAYSGIWLAKKKYLQNIAWEDKLGIDDRYKTLEKIKTIGFDTIQSSTPLIARGMLTNLVEILLSEPPASDVLLKLVNYLREGKKRFKLANIDDISSSKRTNNLSKYIIDDNENLVFGVKCPPNVKAAGHYNFMMNNNKKHKKKYKMIGDGERLKMYHCTSDITEQFAYYQGDYPYEFAPPVNYDVQFEKTVIDPINRILKVLGIQSLNANLIYTTSIF